MEKMNIHYLSFKKLVIIGLLMSLPHLFSCQNQSSKEELAQSNDSSHSMTLPTKEETMGATVDWSNNGPKVDTIIIEQMKFNPSHLIAYPGDTLFFINKDIVDHDVTQKDKEWTSSTLAPGKSWKYVVHNDIDYFCSLHVVMTGKVEVKK